MFCSGFKARSMACLRLRSNGAWACKSIVKKLRNIADKRILIIERLFLFKRLRYNITPRSMETPEPRQRSTKRRWWWALLLVLVMAGAAAWAFRYAQVGKASVASAVAV